MFEEIDKDEQQIKQENTEKDKADLLAIFSGPRALIILILSFLSFAVTTYFSIQLAGTELVINYQGEVYNYPAFSGLYYLTIVLTLLVPIFYLAVYLNAKAGKAAPTAKWFNYARIYFQVGFVLMIIAGIFGVIGMIGVIFIMPGLGFFLMILIGGLFALILWIFTMIKNFLAHVRNNLEAETIHGKADPSKMIILLWISLALSLISLLMGSFTQTADNLLPQAFIDLTDNMALYSGIISTIMSGVLLSLLYQMRSEYTNRKRN